MKYKVGEYVLYSTSGVCNIAEIAERDFGDGNIEYYILKPICDEKSTIFVSVDNESVQPKIKRMLSLEEVHELIQEMSSENTIWIENDNERRQTYKKIITQGNRSELVQLIKTLYIKQEHLKEDKKKLHAADKRFLDDAEKMLYEEFAYVLNLEKDQVVPFIVDQIGEDEFLLS